MTTRLLTLRDVTAITALSRSAIYALMAESRFPKPIRIGKPGRALGRAGGARLHRQAVPAPARTVPPHNRDALRPARFASGATLRVAASAAEPAVGEGLRTDILERMEREAAWLARHHP